MLARTNTICHRTSGVSLETPLLVPSFSSKGFFSTHKDGKSESELRTVFAASGEFITETCLVSAYDIHYDLLPKPTELDWKPELIILDSGGYEASRDRDYSAVVELEPKPRSWSHENYRSVLKTWPDEIPGMFVNYDHPDQRQPFPGQVKDARSIVRAWPQHLHCFLIKPETKEQKTIVEPLKTAFANADDLRSFDVVGVTEKELSASKLSRMTEIARLRRALDEADVKAPIHVFGALDPLSVWLYFVAGAELFDGLTWLRYAYSNGECVYKHNFSDREYGVHVRDDNNLRMRILAHNMYELEKIKRRMQDFTTEQDFRKIGRSADLVQEAYGSLKTNLRRRGAL